jgi:hypothetical protein
MKTFDQPFVREVAQDIYDQRMRTKYLNILQLILREAEQGEFAVIFKKEEIPLECLYWLKDKGFELYTDRGYKDEWFEFTDMDGAFNAKRIKVVW